MNSRSVAVVGRPSTARRNASLGREAKATVSGAARGMAKSLGLGKAGRASQERNRNMLLVGRQTSWKDRQQLKEALP